MVIMVDDDTDCFICLEPLNGERAYHKKCADAEKAIAAHLAGYGRRAGAYVVRGDTDPDADLSEQSAELS